MTGSSASKKNSGTLTGKVETAHRELLKLYMERLQLLDKQIDKLEQLMADALNKQHLDAVVRLAEVPGFGVDSAQQLIAEIGADAEAFPSAGNFASWAGVCPGLEESAETNHSSRSAKGNVFVRRILTQAAQAAVKKKGSFSQNLFRRFLPRMKYNGAIWAVTHRLARLAWKILHENVRYIEQGENTGPQAQKRRAQKLTRALRKLGCSVTLTPVASQPAEA